MRLLICGDRLWKDKQLIAQTIEVLRPEVVIEGEARGADTLARQCAEELGIAVLKFPANWSRYGRAAGVIRNQQMLDEGKPDFVVAFHIDITHSKGTADTVRRAKKAHIPVLILEGKVTKYPYGLTIIS